MSGKAGLTCVPPSAFLACLPAGLATLLLHSAYVPLSSKITSPL